VDDRSRILLASIIGALAGSVAGYLYLTDDGRRLRSRLEPGLDDVVREMRRLRTSVEKARLAAEEGWRTIESVTTTLTRPSAGTSGAGRPASMF
jgi:hypothetical protein